MSEPAGDEEYRILEGHDDESEDPPPDWFASSECYVTSLWEFTQRFSTCSTSAPAH